MRSASAPKARRSAIIWNRSAASMTVVWGQTPSSRTSSISSNSLSYSALAPNLNENH